MIANTIEMALRFYAEVLDAPFAGGTRAAPLEATWQRFAGLAPRAGITRIAELTGLDAIGIPVYAAIRPMGRSLSTQQGKGTTPLAARISALMESLETYSAEHLARPVLRGTPRALANRHRVVDTRRIARAVGAKLARDASLAWVEGFDLVAGEPILVPREAVTLDTTFTRPPVFDISSNGLASGNLRVEAIVHGVCEVIERDAEAAWRRAGGDRRLVLDAITDPACRSLIDRIAAAGARVFVWDLESRIAPAIGCAIMEDPREPAWRSLGFYQGFGAHLDPHVAIARAITEAAQTRVTYIAGGRDDFFDFDYAKATDPALLGQIWDRLAAPCDEPAVVDDLPAASPRSLGDALAILIDRLRAAGFDQVIAVDVTHPELRVPVVKVIVPGLATDVERMG
jgi:ribosomal protein S12 methylthiotransferase accessory factor